MPHFHLYLPYGLLKVKTRRWLRDYERDRQVPVRRFAGWYFIWLRYSERERRDRTLL
ncbi:hypothetical protein ACSSVZ_004550 [Amorphus sp. MBR-141]